MKQYLSSEQTAKLIELGFEKPELSPNWDWYTPTYSVGELIAFLPEYSSIFDLEDLETQIRYWYVGHISTTDVKDTELIDALYNMLIKLKEEGVI